MTHCTFHTAGQPCTHEATHFVYARWDTPSYWRTSSIPEARQHPEFCAEHADIVCHRRNALTTTQGRKP
jgi:hypothetical protein